MTAEAKLAGHESVKAVTAGSGLARVAPAVFEKR